MNEFQTELKALIEKYHEKGLISCDQLIATLLSMAAQAYIIHSLPLFTFIEEAALTYQQLLQMFLSMPVEKNTEVKRAIVH